MAHARLILTIFIVAVPMAAYVPQRMLTPSGLVFKRWADASFPVTWSLNPARGSNVTGARAPADIFRQAFQSWAVVSTARLSFAEGITVGTANAAQDGVNLISMVPSTFGSDAPSITILYTAAGGSAGQFPGQILEADILFNPQAALSTESQIPADRYDLQSLAVHEVGHLLGLDHSALASAAMYARPPRGTIFARNLSTDDVLGISNLYPGEGFFATRGTIQGQVRTPSGNPVFGAHVAVVDASLRPVVSTLTDSDGGFSVRGLSPGEYSAYAEPMDGPVASSAIETLAQAFPGQTPNTAFTTRFAVAPSVTPGLTLTKTAGDNQSGLAAQPLTLQLEVEVRDSNQNLVSGRTVAFSTVAGGGALSPVRAVTDSQGRARAQAYLGKGGAQTFAAMAGTGVVTFNATLSGPSAADIAFLDLSSNAPTKELTVNEGNTIAARVRILDSTGAVRTDVPVSYAISNPEIATVDAAGNVRGLRAGFATLTASGGGFVRTGTVTVVQVRSGGSTLETTGIVQDLADRLYLANSQDHAIRFAEDLSRAPEVYAGVPQTPGLVNTSRLQALFKNPAYLALNQADGTLYVSDSANHVIRRIQPGVGGRVETLAGTGGVAGSQDGPVQTASFNNPQGLALDNAGGLWVADSGNNTIRRINLAAGTVETIAGVAGSPGSSDGTRSEAKFNSPAGIAFEAESVPEQLQRFYAGVAPPAPRILVADLGNGVIRRVRSDGLVETLSQTAAAAGLSDGFKAQAVAAAPLRFQSPTGIAADIFGNIYVTEPAAGEVKAVLRNGEVTSAVQRSTFLSPRGLVVTRPGRVVASDAARPTGEITYGKPEIVSVTPDSVSNAGGSRITVKGKNFAPETTLIIGGTVLSATELRDSETLTVIVPAMPSGRFTLTVVNRGGVAQTSLIVAPTPLSNLPAGFITTIAGGSTYIGDGAGATLAALDNPIGIAVDAAGNVFIADERHHRVRRADAQTGVITTVAGTGAEGTAQMNVLAVASPLSYPAHVAVDGAGNVFVQDSNGLYKVHGQTGVISRISNVSAIIVSDMVADAAGNLYLCVEGEYRVYKIAAGTTSMTLVAGNGTNASGGDGQPAIQASLLFPDRITVDSAGNVYIVEWSGGIRKVDAQTGVITTVTTAISYPRGVVVDGAGNLYTIGAISLGSDRGVLRVDATTGAVSTVLLFERFVSHPSRLAANAAGDLYLSGAGTVAGPPYGHRVMKVAARAAAFATYAGSGQQLLTGDGQAAIAASFSLPQDLTIDAAGNILIADNGDRRIRRIDGQGIVTTIAGNGSWATPTDGQPASQQPIYAAWRVAVDGAGNVAFYDVDIRRIDASTGILTTIAASADQGLAFSPSGDLFYSRDYDVFKIDRVSGVKSRFAGNGKQDAGNIGTGDGGPADQAALHYPHGLAFDRAGNLFIADYGRIRKVDASTGKISTVAGGGTGGDNGLATQARLVAANRLAIDSSGNIFFLDGFYRVRRIDVVTGILTTVAESSLTFPPPINAGDNGPALNAVFDANAIAVDASGNIYLADTSRKRIRAIRGPLN